MNSAYPSDHPAYIPLRRVVSLVPSLTASIIDLDLPASLAGISDYCDPENWLQGSAKRVGGPKTPDVSKIIDLGPDLVLANPEENPREAVDAIRAAGIPVWISFPHTVRESTAELWDLIGFYQSRSAGVRLYLLEKMLGWAEAAAENRGSAARYFCPIWQESAGGETWWMTFNDQTVSGDFLRILGGQNVFAERERRYPLEADLGQARPEDAAGRDTRYARVTLDEIVRAAPEVILLPSEPFAYNENHRQKLFETLAATPAAHNGRIQLVDGQALTWYGTRMLKGLEDLAGVFDFAGNAYSQYGLSDEETGDS